MKFHRGEVTYDLDNLPDDMLTLCGKVIPVHKFQEADGECETCERIAGRSTSQESRPLIPKEG